MFRCTVFSIPEIIIWLILYLECLDYLCFFHLIFNRKKNSSQTAEKWKRFCYKYIHCFCWTKNVILVTGRLSVTCSGVTAMSNRCLEVIAIKSKKTIVCMCVIFSFITFSSFLYFFFLILFFYLLFSFCFLKSNANWKKIT